MSVVAVFDIGKTNVKLCAMAADGTLVEQVSMPNRILTGPPYRHHDLAGLEDWLIEALAGLGRRHRVTAFVPCAHGGSGVLVGPESTALPMVDYEQPMPPRVAEGYRAAADGFRERGGSQIMLGAAHAARQLYWFEQDWPEALEAASAYLHTPQYWSWRMSGVLANEVTSAAAQSHLWCAPDQRPAAILARRGWERLMPPMIPAWDVLGPIRPAIAARAGLDPATPVFCGIHDSSANFYRYQAAGLSDLTVVSTGTWIVALTDRTKGYDFDAGLPGRSCNADVTGAPVPGMLTMGGREFSAVAGEAPGRADLETIAALIASETLVLPFFDQDDGLAPGRAGQGRIIGPLASDLAVRVSLALLYAALLTAEMIDSLPPAHTIVLDGAFVRDPLYGALVQGLIPASRVLVNTDSAGVVAGAALLTTHLTRSAPAPLRLEAAKISGLPDLTSYRALWRTCLTLENKP